MNRLCFLTRSDNVVRQEIVKEATRPIFVISDLHIGDNSNRDNHAFNGREKLLTEFLDYVEKQNGELVILGDLFEFVRCNLGKVLVSRKRLLDRLARADALYITGNHDMELAPLVGSDMLMHPFFRNMTHPFARMIGGRKFMFMHGHEVDPLNRNDNPGWGRIFGIFRGLIEERKGRPLVFHDSVIDFYEKIRSRASFTNGQKSTALVDTPATKKSRNGKRGMVGLYHTALRKSGYDTVVVGHTHKAGRCSNWYFNSGSWTGNTNDYLMIEPNGNVQVCHWTESGPAENHRQLRF